MQRILLILLVTGAFLVVACRPAEAQFRLGAQGQPTGLLFDLPQPTLQPAPGFGLPPFDAGVGAGFGVGYSGSFSSTPMEGAAYGAASIIRARGQAIRDLSEAMINVEDARSKFIENRLRAMEVHFARRDMAERRRLQYHRQRRGAVERWLAARPVIEPGLSGEQFDRTTGAVDWPEPLQDETYAPYRQRVENLLAERTVSPRLREVREGISEAAFDMQSELRRRIGHYSASEYVNAREFLDNLTYTAQNPSS
jgi:hypothetical protein